MRYLLFIFLFPFSSIFAQISAPSLRCLEVLNSTGDVKLSWIPPADPSSSFFAYEIFFSNSPNGPFASIVNSLSPIGTSTFVHTNTVSTTQSGYYFIRTRFGDGSLSSGTSDTLRTIFLNINTSTPDALKITYNNVHKPGLPSSAGTFTLSREYPIGTWNVLSVTPNEVYNDTIAICNAKINYRITLYDNGNCQSVSNINGGTYSDRHDPYEPVVDSISVLPNGNTILGWKIPKDSDVVKYEIQQRQGNINQAIAQLQDRNTTSYILSGNEANTGTVGIYVKAIDSCSRGSLVDYVPTTMFLQHTYDYCAFETILKWNPYKWKTKNGFPTEQVLEYRIYFSSDSGATYSRIDATKDTTYVHRGVTAGKALFYFVRVINQNQTMTASSNRLYFKSGQVPAPSFVYIRTATVTKKTAAEVHISIDPLKPFKEIEIQKSTDGFNFTSLATIPYSGSNYYRVVDEGIETRQQHFYYRAIVFDSCGNLRLQSNTARPILLKVQQDSENLFVQHLSWSEYIGFDGGPTTYRVYRLEQDINKTELIGLTDSATTFFIDNIEEAATMGAHVDYLVEAQEGPANIYRIKELSKSNLAPVYLEGSIFVPNAFAPKGVNTVWKPVTHFIDKNEYSVMVFNRWGQLIFETHNDEEAWDGANCKADDYVYLIKYKNSRGEYQEKKGTVLLIR